MPSSVPDAKRIELIEQLAEVDKEIGELSLLDKTPTNDQIAAPSAV
jgi:hypothetical protein